MIQSSAAVAHPNIAFIKYWGNQNQDLRIPSNNSLSMNLRELETRTQVNFDPSLQKDQLILDGNQITGEGLERVSALLDLIRQLADISNPAKVSSQNNFPAGAGIASSASAFAALAAAGCAAAGLSLSEKELSALARRGSGSASRSIPEGFVEWQAGTDHDSSYAFSFAEPGHWELVDLVVLISTEHKEVGSTQGHRLADTSPLQSARVEDANRRLKICRKAILERDFPLFAAIVEEDSSLMHAVMMTSKPPLYYWQPGTMEVMQAVEAWRESGIPVCFTIDAGPNVHVICLKSEVEKVKRKLNTLERVKSILECTPGGGTRIIDGDFPGV
jgi:diphosphomevalonate decarboxylase